MKNGVQPAQIKLTFNHRHLMNVRCGCWLCIPASPSPCAHDLRPCVYVTQRRITQRRITQRIERRFAQFCVVHQHHTTSPRRVSLLHGRLGGFESRILFGETFAQKGIVSSSKPHNHSPSGIPSWLGLKYYVKTLQGKKISLLNNPNIQKLPTYTPVTHYL